MAAKQTQRSLGTAEPQGLNPGSWRFALAWLFPLAVTLAAWVSPWQALAVIVASHLAFALLEIVPGLQRSPQACASTTAWHRLCVRMHAPLQALLLGVACLTLQREQTLAAGPLAWVALGVAVGWVTGSQGISIAHELGHSRSRLDRALAWGLMGSVLYAHFMVEHYRGHHVRAATHDDPATARRGEGLWRFLPRTLWGCWRSAWVLERARLARAPRRGPAGLPWPARSPLAWVTALQALGLLLLGLLGGPAFVVFWVVQAATAVFLLETVNYIEHYGLQRGRDAGRTEPFAVHHAWNADSLLTNSLLANLQRHSDHHVNPGKPYPTLQALPGPQLPTGYAGCLLLAMWPPLWKRLMHPRLAALDSGAARTAGA